jgi:8-oxo-dGTP pyrophosphatase MutT (NUDIX family)
LVTPAGDGARPAALGPEWRRGPDGRLFRRAARVILVDPDDRVLLVRGHDADQPSRGWWFTVGGGLDDGETSRAAALRELREETGIELAAGALVGPVFTRSAVFDFVFEHCRQDEELFYARVAAGTRLSRSGWTDLEGELLDDLRWFTLDDLAHVTEEVFPVGLVDLVRRLLDGWDGVTRHLDET